MLGTPISTISTEPAVKIYKNSTTELYKKCKLDKVVDTSERICLRFLSHIWAKVYVYHVEYLNILEPTKIDMAIAVPCYLLVVQPIDLFIIL